MNLLQQVFNALSLGAIYALIALGYTMVFGVLKLVNLAHGEVMMVGAYAGLVLINEYNLPVIIAMIGATIIGGITGYLVERFSYRKLLKGKKGGLIISAIGTSLLMQYGAMLLFKSKAQAYDLDYSQDFININGVILSKTKILVLVMSIVFMVILTLFLKFHKIGLGMRAISEKETGAVLCGVNKQKMITYAFVVGCSLAGVSGVVYGSLYMIHPLMGTVPGLKAFCATVLGGVGNIPGAVIGGLMLGCIETFSSVFFNSSLKDGLTYLILILVLLFLPQGITGLKNGDKRV